MDPSSGTRTKTAPAGAGALATAAMLLLTPLAACTGALDEGPRGPTSSGNDGTKNPIEGQSGGPGNVFHCDPNASVDPGPSPLRRLTPAQYAATARSIFGDGLDLSGALPQETNAAHIGLAQPDPSQVDVESYAAAAQRIGAHVEANIAKLAPCDASGEALGARACARRFLEQQGTVIYRSRLSEDDFTSLLALFDLGFEGSGYAHGIGLVAEAMTQAPRFVYRPELGDLERAEGAAIALTGYEVASRLSFAFLGQGPDATLLEAAAAGRLDTPEGIASEAERLFDDPRAKHSLRDFLRSWFGLADFDTVEKDPVVFPEWNEATREMVRSHGETFLDTVLFERDSLESLFSLDPREVASAGMTDFQRAGEGASPGLLALPALLARHSKPTESFPIYRGLFIREQLLCQPLPPPPSDVGEPPAQAVGVTTRERFEQHSSDPACRGCHSVIDPLGFAMESYDAIGRFRTMDEGHPIDASGQLIGTDVDGPFADLTELSRLLSQSDTVRACATQQWFRYVMQRFERPDDGCSMQALAEDFTASGHRFSALRRAIVKTPAFRMRHPIALEGEEP